MSSTNLNMLRRCGSTRTRWTPMTLVETPRGWANRIGRRESASKPARQTISFDANNSHGSSRGSVGGDATTRGGCAPCLGVTLPTSHKCRTKLSWHTSDATCVDVVVTILIGHICILRVWSPILYYDTIFFVEMKYKKHWSSTLLILQCVHCWMCFLCFRYVTNANLKTN
jgi:hypothetical protein